MYVCVCLKCSCIYPVCLYACLQTSIYLYTFLTTLICRCVYPPYTHLEHTQQTQPQNDTNNTLSKRKPKLKKKKLFLSRRQQICLMAPVVLLSLFGNLSVIAVVYLSASLRSTVNYLLVNLAIADFLFTLFCWPLVINRITHPLYVLGRYICKINVLVEGV